MQSTRGKVVQLIHIAKAQLGLDEDTYRAMLQQVTGLTSCSRMSPAQLEAVLEHLKSRGFKPTTRKTFGQRPHNADTEKRAELLKIEALLTDANQPWAYAEAMLKHMTKGRKLRLAFAHEGELNAIIAALHKAACKRFSQALEAEFGPAWMSPASQIAGLLFGFSPKRTLESYPEAMSQVLRWWRGELAAACDWPVVDKPGLNCCNGCMQRALGSQRTAA